MLIKSRHSICSLLLMFSLIAANAQSSYRVGANAHFGTILAHVGSMMYLVNSHTGAGELHYTVLADGKKRYQRVYHLPDAGLSAMFFDFSSPKKIGYGISVYPFLAFPLIRKESYSMKLRVGVSVGYLTKKFDRVENFKNNAIGAHVNGFVNIRLSNEIKLTDKILMEAGFGLSHYSNGAFKMPNLGINIPTVSLGFSYLNYNPAVVIVPDTFSAKKLPWYFTACIGGAKTEVEPPTGEHYAAFSAMFAMNKVVSNKSMWSFGSDVSYNASNIKRMEGDSVYLDNNIKNVQVGIKAAYNITIGNLQLPFELGCYAYSFYKEQGPFYHRIGLRYQFDNNIIANLTLRTHWVKADYFEFGIGYRFVKKQK